MDWKAQNFVKMPVISKFFCRLHTFPFKIPTVLFGEKLTS